MSKSCLLTKYDFPDCYIFEGLEVFIVDLKCGAWGSCPLRTIRTLCRAVVLFGSFFGSCVVWWCSVSSCSTAPRNKSLYRAVILFIFIYVFWYVMVREVLLVWYRLLHIIDSRTKQWFCSFFSTRRVMVYYSFWTNILSFRSMFPGNRQLC